MGAGRTHARRLPRFASFTKRLHGAAVASVWFDFDEPNRGRRAQGMFRVKAWLRSLAAQAGEAYRLVWLLLLYPAAAYLPRRTALALASVAGWGLAASPIGVRTRAAFSRMFGMPSRQAGALAREHLARPFRDYVIARRTVAGREIPARWCVESRNEPEILKQQGKSLIIAAGHFSRQAMGGLYLPHVIPKRLATLVAPMPVSAGLKGFRVRLQLGAMEEAIRLVRDNDLDIVEIGGASPVTGLLRRLRAPDGAAIIAADALWPRQAPGGIERSFAGYESSTYALGAARLARLSQCPVVTCVPYLDSDGRIVLEWGDLIAPPARDDEAADLRITDLILDILERAIGCRPGQYVLPFGHERRWDSACGRWIAASEPANDPCPVELAAPPRRSGVGG